MHNIWLIAKREYLERVRARSFMIMTILIPTIMAGLLFGFSLINGGRKTGSHIAIVASDTKFGLDLQSELQSRKRNRLSVDVISPPAPDTRDVLNLELKDKDLDGYLWVISTNGALGRLQWVPRSSKAAELQSTIATAVQNVLHQEAVSGLTTINAAQEVELDNSQASENELSSSAMISAFGLFFLMYFVILFYGMNVARSIIEEKTSRIFEVMLATISPEEMMAGKVIGVGSVGLTQVGIWIIVGGILSLVGLSNSDISIHLTVVQAIFFVVFFLLGYILYSSVAASLGAMTSSEQELQQMNIFMMLPLIASSIVIYRVVTDPDGAISQAFSFFPFCTPLIMYVRIAVKQPPWYQIALSLAGLVFTIWLVLWIASRIYRVGILMYGKRPNLSELLRWLKYS